MPRGPFELEPAVGERLACLVLACCALAGCSPEPPRNLILISLDTVRRDHLQTYGYARDTAPAIDAFAREAIVFEQAYAQDTNTNPSHGSMFTGLYPHVHGNRKNGNVLPGDRVTLAQLLKIAGFRTAAFVSGVTLHRTACGYERGFDVYEDDFVGQRRDGAITTRLALDWLDQREDDERLFLFVHLFDAHGRYGPEGAYRELFRSDDPGPEVEDLPAYQIVHDENGKVERGLHGYVDRYDSMIRYVDDQVASLLERIDDEESVVIVIGDHGETLGERWHKLNHGGQLFDEQIRIPFILRAPAYAAGRFPTMVETTDLLPTVLELLDVEPSSPNGVQGRSLAPLMRGTETGSREYVYSAARADGKRYADREYELQRKKRIHSVRSNRWKLIRYPGQREDYLELYDLVRDPGERENVAGRFPAVREEYLERLDGWLGDAAAEPDRRIAPEILEKLKDLGYVGD